MGKSILLYVFLFSIAHLHAQTIQDNNRLVYLFGHQQQVFNQQFDWLNHGRAGCEERDIKIVLVDTTKQSDKLYKRYRVNTGKFTLVLVGKDGGEKFRSTKPVTTDQLFAIIDQMPMRQQEIKLKPDK